MAISHVDPYLMERLARIVSELEDRVEGELEDKDWLAITTALSKAILAGFCEGYAEVCTNPDVLVTLSTGEILRATPGVKLTINDGTLSATNLDHDEWSERFGDED